MATPKEAPGELALVRAFVNTLDLDDGVDALGTAPDAASWLRDQGLLTDGTVDDAGRERVVAVREALRELLLANNDGHSAGRAGRSDPAPGRGAGAARRAGGGRRYRRALPHRRRGRCGARQAAGDRLPCGGVGRVEPSQGLPRRQLSLGLLRPLTQPLASLVLHGRLRQPQQGTRVPRATRGRRVLTIRA